MRSRLVLLWVIAAGGLAAAAGVAVAVPFADRSESGASVAPTVRVTPLVVPRGDTITVTGRGWAPNAIVDLLIGPPQSEATAVGRARTTRAGTFRRRLRIVRTTMPGRWVLLGCRRDCRVKAVKSFRVTR